MKAFVVDDATETVDVTVSAASLSAIAPRSMTICMKPSTNSYNRQPNASDFRDLFLDSSSCCRGIYIHGCSCSKQHPRCC